MDSPPTTTRQRLFQINVCLLGFFVLFVAAKLNAWVPKYMSVKEIPIWSYTDWLIDYSAGFIRRGLSGEVIGWLAPYVAPNVAVTFLIWGIFCAVAIAYLRLICRSLDRLSPILLSGLLFLPSLLPFYLSSHEALGRKEVVGFLFVAWHLYLLERGRGAPASVYLKRLWPVILVALPIHVLIHEGTLFLFVPVHVLISDAVLRRDASISSMRRMRTLALLYLPVFLTFAVVIVLGHPGPGAGVVICRRWESVGALAPGSSRVEGKHPLWALPGALAGLAWSTSDAMNNTLSFSVLEVRRWIVVFSVLGFFTAFLGCMVTDALTSSASARAFDWRVFERPHPQKLLMRYFVLPWLISLPLYLVGCDWGRWLAVACINYILVTLSREITGAELPPADGSGHGGRPAFGVNAAPLSRFVFYPTMAAFLLTLLFVRLPPSNIGDAGWLAKPTKTWRWITDHPFQGRV